MSAQLLKRTRETGEQLARVRKQGEDLLRANLSEKAADNGKQQERLAARVQVGPPPIGTASPHLAPFSPHRGT